MTNPNPTNLQASVRQRLKNIADTSGRPFAEVLQWYAIERFLARFAMTPHRDVLLLKGAALLRAWEADPARPTMDIDLGIGRILSVEEATAVVIDCLTAEIEPDGLERKSSSGFVPDHFRSQASSTPLRCALPACWL